MSMCAVLILKCQNVELNKLHVWNCGIQINNNLSRWADSMTVTMSNAHRKQ